MVVRGCGPRGCGPRRCGLRGEGRKNLKFHVVIQNEQNLKCSSLECVVKLWGEVCGREGV